TTANNQVSIMSKGTSANRNTLSTGTVGVTGSENIGVYGEYSSLTTGDITVGTSSASPDMSTASIGVYGTNSEITVGDINVGDYSIGVYGNDVSGSGITAGNITTGENGIGVYGTGTGVENITVSGQVSVNKNGAIGVYGKDINIGITTPVAMTIGEGTSVGIVSEGTGNVNYVGDMSISDKGSLTGSIGIYKKGQSGIITTSSGNWRVGESGYGLYLIEDGGSISAVNNANMTLGMSAVGIYGEGNVTVTNNGHITVGKTYLGASGDHTALSDHRNSVGIYLTDGGKGQNTGIIDVTEEHSVGVYVLGENSYFENSTTGIINVDNGTTGILVKMSTDPSATVGGVALNNGTINIGNNSGTCGVTNIGMAAYEGSTIINGTTGIINVSNGTAMYIGTNGTLDNQGVINITGSSGVGIQGLGTVINKGVINLVGGLGVADDMGSGVVQDGSVVIDSSGIIINGNYVTIGGSITANVPITLNGPYVDITNFGDTAVPLFQADEVNGTINLTPNFVTLGNGYAFVVDNFTKALTSGGASGSITIDTSPMFITNVGSNGELYVAKKPYVELLAPGTMETSSESQFKELYDGLDSLLYGAPSEGTKDSTILKGLNEYLETVFATGGTEAFNSEAARTLSETRGDIYSTIATRMHTVQNTFDSSFEELLNSYNTTKDSGKYSVMYTQGDYSDSTLGIDDYDYRVQGLLYMKEYEGRNFGNKWGYSLGFAVSRFDFDDAPTYGDKSKEDIYSLRAGLHGVKNFNEDDSFRLISRLEIGYNRHESERTLELDKVYKNEGKYNSYQITLDNRLEKTVYRSLSSKVDLYAGLNMEYGKIDGFSEKGDGLELKVKGNDYYSIQPEIGLRAEKRGYIGKKVSAKIFAEGA
ncbi:autotransporter domain-containing protein, partial [Fusobacterium sp. PH5-44]|uniref:autotransporter domain-containing protein n=1 Tax=unclassified Fusobacterium TaxID=2648384 RepID=UPI003D2219FA